MVRCPHPDRKAQCQRLCEWRNHPLTRHEAVERSQRWISGPLGRRGSGGYFAKLNCAEVLSMRGVLMLRLARQILTTLAGLLSRWRLRNRHDCGHEDGTAALHLRPQQAEPTVRR